MKSSGKNATNTVLSENFQLNHIIHRKRIKINEGQHCRWNRAAWRIRSNSLGMPPSKFAQNFLICSLLLITLMASPTMPFPKS